MTISFFLGKPDWKDWENKQPTRKLMKAEPKEEEQSQKETRVHSSKSQGKETGSPKRSESWLHSNDILVLLEEADSVKSNMEEKLR